MGWRNPIRSASNVDTRTAPTMAGVRMYEAPNPDTLTPRGVVEWDDGLPGDLPATLTQTATSNPRSITTPLGSLVVNAGSYNGTQGPQLALNVEQNPAGIGPNVPIARLSSPGGFTVNGVPQVGAPWVIDYSNPSASFTLIGGGWGILPGVTGSVIVPTGQLLELEFYAPAVAYTNGEVALRLLINGTTVAEGADFQGNGRAPVRLKATIAGTGVAVAFQVQAFLVSGSGIVSGSAGGGVYLQHRLR